MSISLFIYLFIIQFYHSRVKVNYIILTFVVVANYHSQENGRSQSSNQNNYQPLSVMMIFIYFISWRKWYKC